MNASLYLRHGWNANPVVIGSLVIAGIVYARFVGRRGRPGCFIGALALVALAFLSPLNLLATGVLFSAHMAQHIILLLLAPALVLLSLESRGAAANRGELEGGRIEVGELDVGNWHRTTAQTHKLPTSNSPTPPSLASHKRPMPQRDPKYASQLPIFTWLLGVGSMWFWHVPQFCNAAAANPAVHTAQTVSLLGMGAAFWWPILSPRPGDRLMPGLGIAYLFSACLACTGLGILLTLTNVDVCPIFRQPSAAPAMWTALRDELTPQRDQQIGGLLMWMPMCLVYVAAIVLELARWLGQPAPAGSPVSSPIR